MVVNLVAELNSDLTYDEYINALTAPPVSRRNHASSMHDHAVDTSAMRAAANVLSRPYSRISSARLIAVVERRWKRLACSIAAPLDCRSLTGFSLTLWLPGRWWRQFWVRYSQTGVTGLTVYRGGRHRHMARTEPYSTPWNTHSASHRLRGFQRIPASPARRTLTLPMALRTWSHKNQITWGYRSADQFINIYWYQWIDWIVQHYLARQSMRELHHWLCLKERIHRFSPSSIPVSNKSPHCWTVWRGGACLWRYYKYYLFLCNIRGRSHPDRPPRTELQILGLKSPIHHPRLSWDACHWTCAWNRFITDQIEGEKKKGDEREREGGRGREGKEGGGRGGERREDIYLNRG